VSEARDRLQQAIIDVDAEVNGERPPNELLTHFMVVYAHAEFGAVDATQVSHIYPESGMPNWQALGLLSSATAYLQHRAVHGDDDE
jgi:hypothetical protein